MPREAWSTIVRESAGAFMTIRQMWLFCLAALVLCLACQSGEKMDPEKELSMRRELALRYYELDDLQRAEDQAQRGLALAPDDKQLQLLIGWIRQRRGRAEDVFYAEVVFRQLADTGDFRAWLGLGEALERKGVFFSEAAEGIESGELTTDALDPDRRAKEYTKDARESWQEAITWYQKVLEKRDGEPQALNGLMRTEALLGNYRDSLRWCNRLIEQCNQEISIWTKQLARPDLLAEEEAVLRALRKSTQDLVQECNLQAATLLLSIGQPQVALESLDSAISIDPDIAELYSRRAQVLIELGRWSDAIASLQDFLRLSSEPFEHPDIQKAYDLIAQCKSKLAGV